MKLGAMEYITKPASLKDLDTLVKKAVEARMLRKRTSS